MDNQFRSAAFGGFNRQDVMDYLERTVKEHNQALEQLNQQLEQARGEAKQLQTQLEQVQIQAREQVEEKTAQQATLLEQLQEENRRLQERVSTLEPDAAAYAAIKERTAGIEMDAHRRAQTIVDEAQAQADQVRREQSQWLERVERDYYDLRAQVGITVTQAASELERVRKGLENITLCMNSQHSALDRLMQTAKTAPAGENE